MVGLSKTRCKYLPVRSVAPSLALHGFGKPDHPLLSYLFDASIVTESTDLEGLALYRNSL
jgi:hypothetical protein